MCILFSHVLVIFVSYLLHAFLGWNEISLDLLGRVWEKELYMKVNLDFVLGLITVKKKDIDN